MKTASALCFVAFFAVAHSASVISKSKSSKVTCDKEGNIRNPDDCSTYYACQSSADGSFIATEVSCYPGLAYDEGKDQCLNPEEVEGCEEYKVDYPLLDTKEERAEEGKKTEVSCEKEGNIRNPDDCSTFYACQSTADGSFTATEVSCYPGLAYDEGKDQCLDPEEVEGCEEYKVDYPLLDTKEERAEEGRKTEVSCEKEGNVRNPDDCSTFYACESNADGSFIATEVSCYPGLAYDEGKDQCLNPEEVEGCEEYKVDYPLLDTKKEAERGNIEDSCEKEGNIRNPEDCGTYYTCKKDVDGSFVVYKMSCYSGLVYDEGKDQCLTPAEVEGCEDYKRN